MSNVTWTDYSNLYCAPMWFDCTKTALTKLKVAYNNGLRRFMGLPWHNSASEMFVNLNIKSFDELLRVVVHGFRSRIIIYGNFMLSSICNSSCSIYSKLWAWWRTLLYVTPIERECPSRYPLHHKIQHVY